MSDERNRNKDLNDLLPSDILSEMDVDTEGSQGYIDNEDEIVDVINRKIIEEKFPYIYNKDRYKTYVKSEDYSDVTFGIALNTYKQCIEKTYQLLNKLLVMFSTQLQYLQICELAYKRLTTSYGENKACKG